MNLPHNVEHFLLAIPLLGIILPRLIGTHHHAFDNIPSIATDDAEPGDVLTIVTPGEDPTWEPGAGPHEIISETHIDTDTADTPGDGDVLTFDTADSKWHPAAPAATGYATVEDEGTPLTQRDTIDFVGAGVSVADTAGVTTVTITAGAGGVTAVRTYISFGDSLTGQAYTP